MSAESFETFYHLGPALPIYWPAPWRGAASKP